MQHFEAALNSITKKTGGYIPFSLDELGGQDWGNLLAVYPTQILDPFDPRVTKTLDETRAKYKEGIMTYGEGRWLHLFSLISPSWLREGQGIRVKDAPTDFEDIDFSLEAENGQALLRLEPRFRENPGQIIFHIPLFVEFKEAMADGKKIEAEEGVLSLSSETKEVHMQWEMKLVGAVSYDYFVQDYKEKYQAKYQELLEKGEVRKE